MDKHALWKWLLLVGLAAWSLALVLPVEKNVKLGLDLRGGTSFTVEIDRTELEKQIREQSPDLTPEQAASSAVESVRNARKQALEIIRNRVDSLGVAEPMIYPEKDDRVVVQIPGLKDADRDRARELIQSAAFLEFSMVHENNDKLVDSLFEKGLAPPGYKIVSVDMKGRSRQFYKREDAGAAANPDGEKEARELLKRFQAPPGYQFMLKQETERGQALYDPYFVRQRCEMRGDTVKNAGYEYDQMGRPYVTLKFDAKGSRQFARVTREFAPGGERNPSPEGRRYLAIILDGTLYSAPYIKTAIYGGEAIIEGDFTLEEAQNLAIVLRAGSLPAPVKIIESRSVDPTLGRDSIESGVRATMYSCIAVIVFMIAYYLLAGVVADIALLFNILLLPLGMMIAAGVMVALAHDVLVCAGLYCLAGRQINMPTIAALLAIVGYSVNDTIVIFDRIRENMTRYRDRPFIQICNLSINETLSRTILTSLTTIMAAVLLFVFGGGAINDFALVFVIGMIAGVYSTVFIATPVAIALRAGKRTEKPGSGSR